MNNDSILIKGIKLKKESVINTTEEFFDDVPILCTLSAAQGLQQLPAGQL